MNVLVYLIAASAIFGALGLARFFWLLKRKQFDDPQGDAHRILSDDYDKKPKE